LLPVGWKASPEAWVAQVTFQDRFLHHFVHEAKKYCNENNLLLKILLSGHPATLCENIKIMHLLPDITYLIQDMDQGAIPKTKTKPYEEHSDKK
jgi:hypothetical protein